MCFWYPVVAKLNSFGFSCVVVGQWYSFNFILVSHFYFEMFGIIRSSPSEVFLGKRVLKICTKFTGEHPCRSVISIKLQNNFIEITLRHECSPVYLLHIFRTPFPKNTSGGLLLNDGWNVPYSCLFLFSLCHFCLAHLSVFKFACFKLDYCPKFI